MQVLCIQPFLFLGMSICTEPDQGYKYCFPDDWFQGHSLASQFRLIYAV